MATTQEDDPFDCDKTLLGLKKKIDTYLNSKPKYIFIYIIA